MKKLTTYFMGWTMLAIFLSACTKIHGIDATERTALLTNKKWQLISLANKASGTGNTNGIDSLPAYRKDDYLLLNNDTTYEINDNLILRPGLSSKVLDAGDWKLIAGNSNLLLHSTIYNRTYTPFKILDISETKMSLETKSDADGSIITMVFVRI